jgi:hypothetical protein
VGLTAQELSPIALVVFTSKRVGKKYRRSIEVSRFYVGTNYSSKTRPVFEARVAKDTLLNALEKLSIKFASRGDSVVELYSEADFRRAIVFAGVRQFIASPSKARDWIDIVKAMSDLEVLLWFTKLSYLHEKSGYWGVYRVAKAITILYKL